MANYMADVSKILGVELGAEFKVQTIKNGVITAIITDEDIYVPDAASRFSEYNKSIVLRNLLLGKFTIKQEVWGY